MIPCYNETFNIDGLGGIDTVSAGRLNVVYVDDSALLNCSRFGVNSARLSDDTSVSRKGPQVSLLVTTSNEENASHSGWKVIYVTYVAVSKPVLASFRFNGLD